VWIPGFLCESAASDASFSPGGRSKLEQVRDELGASLMRAWSEPDFLAMSERFAGKAHHV